MELPRITVKNAVDITIVKPIEIITQLIKKMETDINRDGFTVLNINDKKGNDIILSIEILKE